MSVIFARGSGAGISANTINKYVDISAQINQVGGIQTFDIFESFKNLRIIYNGRNQNQAIIDIDYINYRFTLDFVPNDGQHLAIVYDRP